MVLEKRYPLNPSLTKWVSIGIDPIELSPVVKINNAALKGPKFTIRDWHEFLSLETAFIIFFKDGCQFGEYKMNSHSIRSIVQNEVLMIGIAYNNYELFLGDKSCFNLFNMKELIHDYLNLLCSLNIGHVVDEKISNGFALEHIKSCLHSDKIEHFAIKEMIQFYPHIITEKINNLFTVF